MVNVGLTMSQRRCIIEILFSQRMLAMDAITLSVEIRENRRLVIDLPSDMPMGTAELTIKSLHVVEADSLNAAREAARAKLIAGGVLNTSHRAPEGAVALSNEELTTLGQLIPGAHSSEALIDEER